MQLVLFVQILFRFQLAFNNWALIVQKFSVKAESTGL